MCSKGFVSLVVDSIRVGSDHCVRCDKVPTRTFCRVWRCDPGVLLARGLSSFYLIASRWPAAGYVTSTLHSGLP
jgi:hypothetical protein